MRSHQVTECLMLSIRYPDRGEITAAQQSCQFERIASVGLDLVTWPHRDERWRDYHALDAKLGELPMQRVPGWPSLVGDPQLNVLATQPRHEFADRARIIRNRAVAGWRAVFFGNGHRDRRAMYVQTEVPRPPMLHYLLHWADLHACSSTRDELRPPAQPTVLRAPALPY